MSNVELIISAGRREPSGFRLVATLGLAGLLSGLVLAGVHQITQPTIEANKARALRRAVFQVVPGAADLHRFAVAGDGLVPVFDDDSTAPAVYATWDEDGRFLAWAIDGSGAGFQDTIHILFGFDPATIRVTGMYVLESRETPGLGDKIYKDDAFVQAFSGLDVEPTVRVVKDGRDEPNEVDAITGATISSQAVVKIINEATSTWRPRLPASGTEPAPPAPPVDEP